MVLNCPYCGSQKMNFYFGGAHPNVKPFPEVGNGLQTQNLERSLHLWALRGECCCQTLSY